MTRILPLAILACLLAATLSGCSSQASGNSSTSDALQALDQRQVEVVAGTGTIKGIVVDETIRPVAKATVALSGKQASALTDANGQFVFAALQPGTYFLAVNATHFIATQTSVDVKAGEVVSARVQIQHSNDPLPYHTTLKFQGNMALYVSAASFALELFVPNSALCQCTFNITPDPGVKTFIYEATGHPATTNPLPVYGTIYWEFIGQPQNDIRSAHGNFPVYQVFQRDAFANDTKEWTVRLTGSQWVHYNTDFTIFMTEWYHEDAPKGWSFVKGDE